MSKEQVDKLEKIKTIIKDNELKDVITKKIEKLRDKKIVK